MTTTASATGSGARGESEGGPLLRLSLFGPFEARVNGVPMPRLRTRKGQWLLALLALRAGSELHRGWLAGTLWPESDESLALTSLRKSLADLRGALGPAAAWLRAPTTQILSLDPAGLEADVLTFDRAIARGDAASLQQAISLYRGPLLEGCAEEWVLPERERREQAYLGALERLAAHAVSAGDLGAAERHLRLAVGVDPLRESAQRALMGVLARGGSYGGGCTRSCTPRRTRRPSSSSNRSAPRRGRRPGNRSSQLLSRQRKGEAPLLSQPTP
jgi:DNA-binding SARP family transcriptional activator